MTYRLQIERKYSKHIQCSFLLDEAVVDIAAVEATVVVVVTEHMSMKENGIHTGDKQHALTTHTDFTGGHPEPFIVHTSNNEHGGTGAHTFEPVDVLNE